MFLAELRVYIAEMVERADSGHPGGPMGIIPVSHVLFTKVLRITAANPQWMDRDIFVLSNGHCCAMLYLQLALLGFLDEEELLRFRKIGSKTPGHPESCSYIEATTGPLGQGVAQSVGYAIALANLKKYNTPDTHVFTNRVYCILGDGCMQEGISNEAFSLAGHLKLSNLVFVYDSNNSTIDGPAILSMSENVRGKMEALGFVVSELPDPENAEAVEEALKRQTDRPHFIIAHTSIAKGCAKEGSAKSHGAPLGQEVIDEMKSKAGITETFYLSQGLRETYKARKEEAAREYEQWQRKMEQYMARHPEKYRSLTEKPSIGQLVQKVLEKKEIREAQATRKHLSTVLAELSSSDRILGGSGDLTPSTLTRWPSAVDFSAKSPFGAYIRFGIREHAMFGILCGISGFGWHIPFGSTFLNFVTYGFGALRIACISERRLAVFATHDSVALGEDGPTHQPVETLALLRATPNLYVLRPADGIETAYAVYYAFEQARFPCVVSLTRQKLSPFQGTDFEKCRKGAYVVSDYSRDGKRKRVLIVATGSEVSLACKAKALLEEFDTRIVSLISFEIFEEQPEGYRRQTLECDVSFGLEALSTFGWKKYVQYPYGLDRFGMSGPSTGVYEYFGFTDRDVAAYIQKVMHSTLWK